MAGFKIGNPGDNCGCDCFVEKDVCDSTLWPATLYLRPGDGNVYALPRSGNFIAGFLWGSSGTPLKPILYEIPCGNFPDGYPCSDLNTCLPIATSPIWFRLQCGGGSTVDLTVINSLDVNKCGVTSQCRHTNFGLLNDGGHSAITIGLINSPMSAFGTWGPGVVGPCLNGPIVPPGIFAGKNWTINTS